MEKFFEKWNSRINEVRIGSRYVGGARSMPFVKGKDDTGHPPLFAIEISDVPPAESPSPLVEVWQEVWASPTLWAQKAVSLGGADAICIRLTGAHPDEGDKSADECVRAVREVSGALPEGMPIIVAGCGFPDKDNEIIPAVSDALKGKNILLGIATKENYKVFASSAIKDGHSIITEAPVDINLAKQLHILLSSEAGFPIEKIVLHQTTAALGYGYEYCYSIMEKTRIAGLEGDRMLAVPMISFAGTESWKVKESITPDGEAPQGWGSHRIRGIMWETVSAAAYLEGGADIVVMSHPQALTAVKKISERLLTL